MARQPWVSYVNGMREGCGVQGTTGVHPRVSGVDVGLRWVFKILLAAGNIAHSRQLDLVLL